MNRTFRLILVAIIGLVELISIIATLATFDQPVAEFGYNVGPDGVTVMALIS